MEKKDGSKRSVKTYAGGGLTGYNAPVPTWDQWGRGGMAGGTRLEEGGKITFKTSTGQVNEYPDTEKGRSMREEDKITDSIAAERKAKAKAAAKAKAKAKKAEDIKKSQARAKKAKKAGVKKYGKHWAQGKLEDMGSGRE